MRIFLILPFLVLIAAGPCSDRRGAPVSSERQLADTLENILSDTRVRRSLDDSSDLPLLENAMMQLLYRQSFENEQVVRLVIQDPRIEDEVKQLAILTMQCLPLDNYIELLESTQAQVEEGHAGEAVLADAVFPGEQWGTVIAEHYRDPRVVKLLATLRAKAKSRELQDRLDSVLRGEAARYVQHLRATGERVPVFSCDEPTE